MILWYVKVLKSQILLLKTFNKMMIYNIKLLNQIYPDKSQHKNVVFFFLVGQAIKVIW